MNEQGPWEVKGRETAIEGFWVGEETDVGNRGDMEEPFGIGVVRLCPTGR